MADLDGQNIDSVVTATSPFAVEYYTDTGSLSAIPTHSPTADPSPFPSLSYDPTSEPTAIPTMPPTPLPSYYWSRLYFTAGTTTGGSFLYMSRPDGGQGDEEPIQLTKGTDGGSEKQMDLGVSWSRDPALVFWIDANENRIKRKKMNEDLLAAKTVWKSSVGDIYNLQAMDDWLFVTGDATNSLTKMTLMGGRVKTFLTGINRVTGLDVTRRDMSSDGSGGYKIFFTSGKTGIVYSVHDDGNNMEILITGLHEPNDVVYVVLCTLSHTCSIDSLELLLSTDTFAGLTKFSISYTLFAKKIFGYRILLGTGPFAS